ncbi:transport-associated protein [Stanieria cyanosphaera PCC 7437]|uniref:Transport-associated protein n=1 Tax=Stanieria cyanosphaera (strain ATCC 29371 / PCC 7437) TaxID=111780 RepID=K9XP53_STAC7|nr:BON domain-containing protein [Stanieria cyanosphaera]AFZ33826.1 transport-associated protein [Stanieria cyanosphaera PCC 7437]
MKKLSALLLGSVLMFGAVACDGARTSSDAPDTTGGNVNNPERVQETKEDGVSEVRRDQLNSDIRAREQRNDIAGNQNVRDDSDLESQVRAKLEANIPRSQLRVEAENGTVVVAGTVPSQDEYNKIEPLANEIRGVNAVKVNVDIVPATETN